MKKFVCDICNKDIKGVVFSVNISSNFASQLLRKHGKEIILRDVCEDCINKIHDTIGSL